MQLIPQAVTASSNELSSFADVSAMARSLITEHLSRVGYPGWTFQFDRAVRRIGYCKYEPKIISLSAPYVEQALKSDSPSSGVGMLRNTVLHEIAHARAFAKHGSNGVGHGALWAVECHLLGIRADRCTDVVAHGVERPKAPYEAYCPTCRKTRPVHRRKTKPTFCSDCLSKNGRQFVAEIRIRYRAVN